MDVTILTCEKHHQNTNFSAFTLIELLIVLAISSITFALIAPGLQGFYVSLQSTAIINGLSSDMAYTRSEAIKRVSDVILCKSTNGQFCTENSGWETGWIIFVDIDQSHIRENNEPLLRVQGKLQNNIVIKYNAFKSNHYISFHPSGRTEMNGTFRFCINNSQYNKDLILAKTGRVRLLKRNGPIIDKNSKC